MKARSLLAAVLVWRLWAPAWDHGLNGEILHRTPYSFDTSRECYEAAAGEEPAIRTPENAHVKRPECRLERAPE
jgi:hypothetical protein